MKNRKRLITIPRLIVLAVILLCAIMGLWILIRGQLIAGFDTGVETLKADGYQVIHDELNVDGFPFKIDAKLGALMITAPAGNALDTSKNWSLKAKEVSLSSAVVTPLSWTLTHAGTLRVDMRGPAGERYNFDVVPADITASGGVDFKGQLKSARILAPKTRIDSIAGEPIFVRSLGGLKADINVKGGDGAFMVDIADLVLDDTVPEPVKSLLGADIKTLSAAGTIDNIQSLIDGEITNWQDSGARINIEAIAIQWGAFDMTGGADITFANDEANGTVTVKFAKLETLLTLLNQNGILQGAEYQMARLYVKQTKKDENGRVAVPLTIKDNQLKFFAIVLADFNP